MSEHFEDIWNEAESLTERKSLVENINDIKENFRNIEFTGLSDGKDDPEISHQYGEILFNLAAIAKDLNINVAAALKLIIDEKKIDNYE